MTFRILLFLFVISFSLSAQGLKVEYDKNHDFTQYKTFAFGEGEIITPKEERTVKDEDLQKWVRTSIAEELKEKGLQEADSSSADLIVSYVIGSLNRRDVEQLGPLGQTPGDNSRTWSRDYAEGSFIIDLNERNKKRVWRINASTNTASSDQSRMIDQVVGEGFKKFSLKPKKSKKK
ncbi:MAG: hypothetical protein DI538_03345 [Azospira oryzae]|nr:MAG: hypothetical protein DI538_03345 [Azospira oryzae]